ASAIVVRLIGGRPPWWFPGRNGRWPRAPHGARPTGGIPRTVHAPRAGNRPGFHHRSRLPRQDGEAGRPGRRARPPERAGRSARGMPAGRGGATAPAGRPTDSIGRATDEPTE